MEHNETTTESLVDLHAYATMRWGAIIGGWIVATGIASLMYLGGLALGFTVFDPYSSEAIAKGIGMGTAAWMVLTWAVALFLGGMFASWFDGRSDQTVGTLHGVTVWGLSVAAGGLLLAIGLSHVVQAGAAIVGGGATAMARTAGMGAPQRIARGGVESGPTDDALIGLQAQLMQSLARSSSSTAGSSSVPVTLQGSPPSGTGAAPGPSGQGTAVDGRRDIHLDRQDGAAVASALLKGHTETAKAVLAANTSMSQAEIDQTLQGLSAQVEKYKADAQAAVYAAARYSATAMWIFFISALVALVAAALGGWMGAGHIHRVHHLRRYKTATSSPL